MSLRRRLERLGRPSVSSQSAASAPASSVEPEATREETLSELRRKMQALLGNGSSPLPPVDPARAERDLVDSLGLLRVESTAGVYLSRRLPLPLSHRVGRISVLEAKEAPAQILALLALDEQLGSVDFSRALFLDTETTGLGGGTGTLPFLVGLGYFRDGSLWLEQLLLAGPEQERAMLERVRVLWGQAEVLVSFNGKAFDWPLLKSRYVMNRLSPPEKLPHLDLLHVARRIHRPRLQSCTLKHVESLVLGFERLGDIDGAEVAARYQHYLRSGDGDGLSSVVEHNRWDVVSMAALVALYGEAVPDLLGADLVALCRTYRRGKAWDHAAQIAEIAIERGGGGAAYQARAEVRKALGDRLQALADYERAEAEEGDPGIRLELAKLYEHFMKDPQRALATVRRGTSESVELTWKREERLVRKLKKP